LVLLAPATARASSFSPDPAPGSKAKVLKPDPAPSAAVSTPKPKVTTTSRRPTSPAPVVRPVVVPVVHTTPVVTHTPTVHRAKPKAAARPKPKPVLVVPALPRVLVPRFIEAPLSSDPPRALAALALALAALTALSGAGVVFSWSRR
jgi:hypothetical protein